MVVRSLTPRSAPTATRSLPSFFFSLSVKRYVGMSLRVCSSSVKRLATCAMVLVNVGNIRINL